MKRPAFALGVSAGQTPKPDYNLKGIIMNPVFDDQDNAILARRVALWDEIIGPRVGDFCRLIDGTTRRFTHDWDDSIQTSSAFQPGDQSFYFGDGYMSFSGSLDSAIPKTEFVPTDETLDGSAWFFHNDHMRAHNGVYFKVPCRVFAQVQL